MNIVFLDVVLFHIYIQNITVYNLHISIPSDHYLVVEPGFRPSVFCCSYFESVSCHVPKGLKALWPEPCTWDDGLGRCTVDGVIIGVKHVNGCRKPGSLKLMYLHLVFSVSFSSKSPFKQRFVEHVRRCLIS